MPSSDDLLAGGPPIDDAATDTPYLGVPKGYVAQRPNPNPTPTRRPRTGNVLGVNVRMPDTIEPASPVVNVPPRYFKGDEFSPSTLAAEDRARLQLAMRNAGLYSKSERFQLGVWDANTRGAYKRLLEYANGAGLAWQEALSEFGAMKQQMGDTVGEGGSERAPLAVRLPNPNELRRAFDVGLREATGVRADPGTIERVMASYQNELRREQTEAYNVAEAGGTVTEAPSLESFVEDQAEEVNPQGAFRQRAIGTFAELGEILGGGDSG